MIPWREQRLYNSSSAFMAVASIAGTLLIRMIRHFVKSLTLISAILPAAPKKRGPLIS